MSTTTEQTHHLPTDDELFTLRHIKPTAVRALVLAELERADCALSLTDLEARLMTVDKSSIFRTLTLFLSHHMIHSIEDGSGMTKYALCAPSCHCGESEHKGDMNDFILTFVVNVVAALFVCGACLFHKYHCPRDFLLVRPIMC